MMAITWILVNCFLSFRAWASCTEQKEWTISNLRTEYLSSTAYIDTPGPRLSWVNQPPASSGLTSKGSYYCHQSKYQIQVIDVDIQDSLLKGGALLWDSGEVVTSQGERGVVRYGSDAPALQSARVYEWRARTWLSCSPSSSFSDEGEAKEKVIVTPWSTPARFITGLMDSEVDWKGAYWIGHNNTKLNLFRHHIALPSIRKNEEEENDAADSNRSAKPIRALLFVSGLGYHYVSVDGQAVNDAKMEPGYTAFAKRAFYSTYDLSPLILFHEQQPHTLDIELGNGYFTGGGEPNGKRILLAKLIVLYSDGSRWEMGTDETWQCTQGPRVYDSVFNGEIYDARVQAALDGRPSDVDIVWSSAMRRSGPGGELHTPLMPSIRPITTLPALCITEPQPGVFVFDFGQNIAGVCRTRFPLNALKGLVKQGHNFTLRHAEVLQHPEILNADEDYQVGMIYTDNLHSARATDTYIYAADLDLAVLDPAESPTSSLLVYEPIFTYHGFRYVELRGQPPSIIPSLDWLVAVVQNTDVEPIGQLKFSNLILNGIHHNTLWSQVANLMSIPTDCPNRDERKGYTGDAQLSAEEAIYNFDMTATYLKYLRDILLELDANNTLPDSAPFAAGFRPADPSWSTAFPSITYYLYRDTGDSDIAREFYPGLVRYVDWLESQYQEYGLVNFTGHFGEWVAVGWPHTRLNVHITASSSYIENLQQMAFLAHAIGRDDEAERYADLYANRAEEWHAVWYNESIGSYGGGEQTSVGLAFAINAVPGKLKADVAASLIRDILVTNKGHQSTGIIGTKYMFEILSAKLNRTDVGLIMAAQADYPSFGYMLFAPNEPSTTLWELWDSDQQNGFMNSRNHIMFGSIDAWFARHLVGIQPSNDPDQAGYRQLIIRPYLDPCMRQVLNQAKGSTRTIRGLVEVAWQWDATGLYILDLTVPEGGQAKVHLQGPQDTGRVSLVEIDGVPPSSSSGMIVPELAQSIDLHTGVHKVIAIYHLDQSCAERYNGTVVYWNSVSSSLMRAEEEDEEEESEKTVQYTQEKYLLR